MKNRSARIRTASAVILLAGVTCAAFAQAPQPGSAPPPPKFYPGTISPNPAHSQTYPPPAGQPRLTQPVVAGPDGVRTVAASDGDLKKLPPTGDLPRPGMLQPSGIPELPGEPKTLPPIPDAVKPPTVVAERSPALPGLPPGPGSTPPGPAPLTAPSGVNPVSPPLAANLTSSSAPNVSVTMEAPESIGVGQPCSYTLLVRNLGTVAVTGVRVDHELPSGAAHNGSEPPAETAGEGRLAWVIGNLEAGGEKRIKITVTPADEGELRGRASVTFSTGVEAKVKVTRPRISVTLTGPDVVRVGEPVIFNVKLTNTGSGPANKMRLHARFTEGLRHKNGQVIEGMLDKPLEAGGVKIFPLEVVAARPGQETFVLSVFADANQPETAKAAVTLVEPQLVAKQTGPVRCLVRAEPVYQIDLSNPGSAATDPIRMWTAVPDGFEFVQASDGGSFDAGSKSVMWRLNGLPAGSNKAVTVKLRAVAPNESSIRTTVQAGGETQTAPGGVAQVAARGKPLETRAETLVKAEGVAALRFDLTGQDGLVEVGKETVYEIKIVNHGTGPCTNVQLVAELADGTSMSASAGPTNGRGQGTQTVVFEPLPQLAAKAEAIYRMRVKGTIAGDMRFRVKLTCDQVKTPTVKEENTKFYKE